ncbi:dihydrodipicolinate synthase family protein [Pseudomonas sp. R5(2019)]|uniref:dihydrodipicolinate synthase family protein n=1 Tax=Pseudomonas sp. R5(2019) TaxID=2697566 RepID=UPI001411EB9B|nr:dihydrodipicolinate synthase family protein [Pseudomonas sp. R5(2019)]NBA94804.1 DUF993 family protein [Pseudomonas sp. R5(2019)]
MSLTLNLPTLESAASSRSVVEPYRLCGAPLPILARPFSENRIALSAAHVVVDPLAAGQPGGASAIDWERTLHYRRFLLEQGLGIAEAMDTAQRGMGLDWPTALKLIQHTLEHTRDIKGAMVFSGCGTDQLAPEDTRNLDDVLRAYDEQHQAIGKLGGRIILMASRALARVAKGPEDYRRVYGNVLADAQEPVILHWLGDMFDPALHGYWGTTQFEAALETCLEIIHEHEDKIDGIKLSLLDKDKEITLRRRLPASVKMYTGDDFNYPELIQGDEQGYSHALLGIFDAIAPAASQALTALERGNVSRYNELLAPTLPLARLIFSAPTQYYKTGVVFLAWLNGHQDHFVMLNGHQAMRPLAYFCEIFRLADQAGLLSDPDRAVIRMRQLLQIHGVAA